MFRIDESDSSITFLCSSEMRLVDRVITESIEFMKQFGIDECKDLKLVLRELLINAVEHGNLGIVERSLSCSLEHIGNRRFKVVVEDEGDGFDFRNLDMNPPSDPRQVRNRGYVIINAMADEIQFNEKGNRVTAYVSTPQFTTYALSRDGDFEVVTPSGDLTAGTADAFRSSLLSLADQGKTRFRFDFAKVEDIDSISLSVLILFANLFSANREQAVLEVVHANDDLVKLFEMTRTDKVYVLNPRR